jgi:hypothetical protein
MLYSYLLMDKLIVEFLMKLCGNWCSDCLKSLQLTVLDLLTVSNMDKIISMSHIVWTSQYMHNDMHSFNR